MPSHRGAHPQDEKQFAESELSRLRSAVHDLSWLRSRGYGDSAALKLVGDRHRLKRRQRNAVARSACSDREREHRRQALLSPSGLAGRHVEVDAFNVLITVEGAMGGAYLFVGRDGAMRDVNPLQGSYRVVQETDPALRALLQTLQHLAVEGITWHLDAQVSNVGRVKARLQESAPRSEMRWEVTVERDVDARLQQASGPVVTSDSAILDASSSWFQLEAAVISHHSVSANVRDLRPDGERMPLSGSLGADQVV